MFQFLKSLFSRGGPPGSVTLRVYGIDLRYRGRYRVLVYMTPAGLLQLAAADDPQRLPRLALAAAGGLPVSDALEVPRADFDRVLSAYRQNPDVTVLIAAPEDERDDSWDRSDRYSTPDRDSSTSSTPPPPQGEGRYGGGGASGSWDTPAASVSQATVTQDAAAAAALGALGVAMVSEAGDRSDAVPGPESAATDSTGTDTADNGGDSSGYDR